MFSYCAVICNRLFLVNVRDIVIPKSFASHPYILYDQSPLNVSSLKHAPHRTSSLFGLHDQEKNTHFELLSSYASKLKHTFWPIKTATKKKKKQNENIKTKSKVQWHHSLPSSVYFSPSSDKPQMLISIQCRICDQSGLRVSLK